MTDKKTVKKNKKDVQPVSIKAESQDDFLKRIKSVMDSSAAKFKAEIPVFSKEYEEGKAGGAKIAATFKELEECKKIEEEFKKNPPILTTKYIGGVCVERYYDPKVQPGVDLLKKHLMPFLSVTHSTSIFPIVFNAFNNAYIKRGAKKVILPESSSELPFIIKDGDIIGTEDRSFVLELKNEDQDEENNFWHIFIFPNSELKISIKESVSHPAPAYMVPSQVPDAIKNGSTSTVYKHAIESIELLSGLFNIRVKKRGRDVNNIVKFAPGFPGVEFNQAGGLVNEMVKNEMEKAVRSLGAAYLSKVSGTLNELRSFQNKKGSDEISSFIELNKNGSVVIFATNSRVSLRGSGRMTQKISGSPYNPVKITATNGSLFETDGSKNPDSRVEAVMKMWLAISQYAGSLTPKKEPQLGMGGRTLDIEDAKIMIEYAKALGERDIEKAAEEILKNRNEEMKTKKPAKEQVPDIEGQKREAEEMLKFAEESGEEELIAVAKAQVQAASAGGRPIYPGVDMAEMEESGRRFKEFNEKNLEKCKAQIEAELPPYNRPNSSDAV